jgi:hypothetical protein
MGFDEDISYNTQSVTGGREMKKGLLVLLVLLVAGGIGFSDEVVFKTIDISEYDFKMFGEKAYSMEVGIYYRGGLAEIFDDKPLLLYEDQYFDYDSEYLNEFYNFMIDHCSGHIDPFSTRGVGRVYTFMNEIQLPLGIIKTYRENDTLASTVIRVFTPIENLQNKIDYLEEIIDDWDKIYEIESIFKILEQHKEYSDYARDILLELAQINLEIINHEEVPRLLHSRGEITRILSQIPGFLEVDNSERGFQYFPRRIREYLEYLSIDKEDSPVRYLEDDIEQIKRVQSERRSIIRERRRR